MASFELTKSYTLYDRDDSTNAQRTLVERVVDAVDMLKM